MALLDGDTRAPLDTLGKPQLNWPSRSEAGAAAAETLGVALGAMPDPAQRAHTEDRGAAVIFNRLADDCRGARTEWVNALARVARAASPFVDGKDMAPLFEKARASGCMKAQDELGRRRVALFEAINALDARAMSEHATWALTRLPLQLESERSFLVVAALAGAIASGNFVHARALADAHVPRLPRRERDGPMVQLLLGHLQKAR